MVILKLKQCSHTRRMIDHLALQDPSMAPKGRQNIHEPMGRGGTGGPDPTPLKKNTGFLCNTALDPLKNHKATKPAFNVGPS